MQAGQVSRNKMSVCGRKKNNHQENKLGFTPLQQRKSDGSSISIYFTYTTRNLKQPEMLQSLKPKHLAVVVLITTLTACESDRGSSPMVTVDPRIELMGIVQYLAGYTLSTTYELAYVTDIENHFGSYREHDAVAMFRVMSPRGFSFDAVPKAMLSLGDPPLLEQVYNFPSDVVALAGGQEALENFVSAMRDFATQTAFETFYIAHQPFYDSLTTATVPAFQDAVGALDQFLGRPVSNATLILGATLHRGGFTTLFETSNSREVFAVVGPASAIDSFPQFGTPRRIGSIVWHEYAHTVVNQLTADHSHWLTEHADRHAAVAEHLASQGYNSWSVAVNEHIIRAITARMLDRHLGRSVGLSSINTDVNRGFAYVPGLVRKLEEYEQDREAYPTLEEFYPELLTAFLDEPTHPDRP